MEAGEREGGERWLARVCTKVQGLGGSLPKGGDRTYADYSTDYCTVASYTYTQSVSQ